MESKGPFRANVMPVKGTIFHGKKTEEPILKGKKI